MKKILVAAVVAFSSLAANAQIWMGGSLGFDYTDNDNSKAVTTFTISPEVGYTLDEKWDLGLAINANFKCVEDGDNTNTFSVEPYARYTFAKAGIASFFVDGGFYVGSTNDANGVKMDDVMTWGVGVRPGVKVALADNVSLVTKLGWLGYKDVEDTYSKLGFNVNNNALSFGLYWNF